MNSQEYWRKRILYTKRKQLDHERDYELAMRARLRALENEIIKEARHWVSKYANENHLGFKEAAKLLGQIDTSRFDMTLKEFEEKARAGGFDKELNSAYYKSRIARLQKLQQQFIEFAGNYADKEEGIMAKALADQYQFTYDQDGYSKYLVTGGIDVDYTHFNEDQLRSIVYQPWQGSDFSKRIWNNYTNVLPEVLTNTMFKATALGYSHTRLEQELRSTFHNVESNNLHRLIVTEMGHITEQATADFYEDSNIEQYQYLATLETHTCEICAHLDERIFYVKDRKPGLNYPMIHPYCRCTTVPYMKDLPDIVSRWSRDDETGKGKFVNKMSFNQWVLHRSINKINRIGSTILLDEINLYKNVIPVFLETRNIPTKKDPFSVVGKMKNGKVIQYRYYGENGLVEKDLDLTDHGNPKEHTVVPHVHRWKHTYNQKNDKIIIKRGRGVAPSKNELEDIKRWRMLNGQSR